MSKEKKEEEKVSKPNISFRDDPEVIQLLKEELGIEETAAAIRKAIRHMIRCDKKLSVLSEVSELGQPLSVRQVADLLGTYPRKIRRLIASKQIKAHKFGREWQIYPDEVERFLLPRIKIVTQA